MESIYLYIIRLKNLPTDIYIYIVKVMSLNKISAKVIVY